jgi:hypothetical protein
MVKRKRPIFWSKDYIVENRWLKGLENQSQEYPEVLGIKEN